MRHLKAGRKLGRNPSHRKALFRNMADSLIRMGRIRTTLHKAKELQPVADRLVTLGKDGSLAARRMAVTMIRSPEALDRLFGEIAKSFQGRNGGYTRILKLSGRRLGDGAELAMIEYIDVPVPQLGKVKEDDKGKKKAKKGSEESSTAEGSSKEASSEKKAKKAKSEKSEKKEKKASAKADAGGEEKPTKAKKEAKGKSDSKKKKK